MAIIALFIDFVCCDTDVRRLEEITHGIANSYFRQWYQRKVGDRTECELKTAIKEFFRFLAQESGRESAGAARQSRYEVGGSPERFASLATDATATSRTGDRSDEAEGDGRSVDSLPPDASGQGFQAE